MTLGLFWHKSSYENMIILNYAKLLLNFILVYWAFNFENAIDIDFLKANADLQRICMESFDLSCKLSDF